MGYLFWNIHFFCCNSRVGVGVVAVVFVFEVGNVVVKAAAAALIESISSTVALSILVLWCRCWEWCNWNDANDDDDDVVADDRWCYDVVWQDERARGKDCIEFSLYPQQQQHHDECVEGANKKHKGSSTTLSVLSISPVLVDESVFGRTDDCRQSAKKLHREENATAIL